MKNLITRALTGIIFVAVLVGAIYFHSYYFLAVFGLITGLSLWEFYGLVKHYENAAIKRFVSSLGGAYLFAATFGYANGLVGGNIFLPYLLFLMYTMITELYDKASNPINNWALTLFGQIYCAGSFSLLNFITSVPNTPGEIVHIPYFALAIFVFVWVNDTGAYLVGSMLGKKIVRTYLSQEVLGRFLRRVGIRINNLPNIRLVHAGHKLVHMAWISRHDRSIRDLGRLDRIFDETYVRRERFRACITRTWRHAGSLR